MLLKRRVGHQCINGILLNASHLPQLLFINVFLKFLRLNIQIVIWLGINLIAALWQLLDQTLEVVYVNGLIGKAPANLPVALGLTESPCALLQPKKMVILLLLNF